MADVYQSEVDFKLLNSENDIPETVSVPTICAIKGEGGGGGSSAAEDISYDNTESGLAAVNAQEAIDELAAAPAYTLPTASETVLGGVKVGSGLSITDGVLSAEGGGIISSVEVLGDWS